MRYAAKMPSDNAFRRVVVALDPAADFAATIGLAATVAAGLGAMLRGLLVEDESLRRLAELPFAQQIDAVTASRSRFGMADLDLQMKSLAERIRGEMQRIADAHALAWSFETLRASISAEILSLAGDDLLAVGIKTGPASGAWRLGSPWLRVLGQVTHPILLVPERPAAAGPVMAVVGDTAAGRRALDASERIARRGRRPLIVAVSENVAEAEAAAAEAVVRAASAGSRLLRLQGSDRPSLPRLIASSKATLLVVGRDGASLEEITKAGPLPDASAILIL